MTKQRLNLLLVLCRAVLTTFSLIIRKGFPLLNMHEIIEIIEIVRINYFVSYIKSGNWLNSLEKPHLTLVGASAGVYALITAVLANAILNWDELNLYSKIAKICLAVGYLIFDCIEVIFIQKLESKFSILAHFGGALAKGSLSSFRVKVTETLKKEKWNLFGFERVSQTISFKYFKFLSLKIIFICSEIKFFFILTDLF